MTDVPAEQPSSQPETTSSPPETATTPESLASAAVPAALTADAFTLPEGFTLSETPMNSFLEIMNNSALSPAERGQALINLQAGLATQSEEARSQAWNDLQQTWQSEVQADKEIGGANLPATLTSIGHLMDRFANDEVRQALDQTGAGNHPAIVKFLFNLSKQLTEGTPATPGAPAAAGSLSLSERIYGKPKQ